MMRFLIILTLAAGLSEAQTPSPESAKFFSNTVAQESGGLANTLLMMSLASMGATLTAKCVSPAGTDLPDSVIIFATASDNYARAEALAANAHRLDLEARLAEVRAVAGTSRVRGGGDTQRKILLEALAEQMALLSYISMKKGWLEAAIVGFNNSATEAINEQSDGITPEDTVNCAGVFPASVPVSQAFITAYEVFGFENKISTFLPNVLPIAVTDLLPLVPTPDKRLILANIAVTAAAKVIEELGAAAVGIQANITNTQKVIAQFDLEEGVSLASGVDATVPNPATGGVDFVAASSLPTTGQAGATFTPVVGGASAAAPRKSFPQGACLSPPDMTKSTKDEICKNPPVFNESTVQVKNVTVKSASDASMRFSTALASGNVKAASVAASTLSALAGRVETAKQNAIKTLNADRLKQGRQMIDMDTETKKSISKVVSSIRQEVIKAGGAPLLASKTNPAIPTVVNEVPEATNEVVRETGPQRTTRLSAPKYVPTSAGNTPASANTTAAEEETSLWEKLSNRYRAKFFRTAPL